MGDAKPRPGWNPPAGFEPARFVPATIEKLRSICDDDGFIDELREIKGRFHWLRATHADKPKPAEVIAALNNLQTKLADFLQTAGSLDHESYQALKLNMERYTSRQDHELLTEQCEDHLWKLHRVIDRTIRERKEHQDRASNIDASPKLLAGMVASVLEEHGIKTSAYIEGPFIAAMVLVSGKSAETCKRWAIDFLNAG